MHACMYVADRQAAAPEIDQIKGNDQHASLKCKCFEDALINATLRSPPSQTPIPCEQSYTNTYIYTVQNGAAGAGQKSRSRRKIRRGRRQLIDIPSLRVGEAVHRPIIA